MKIPSWILSVFISGTVAWAAWMSHQVIELKSAVATIEVRLAGKGGAQ